VRNEVYEVTNGEQQPWTNSALRKEIFLTDRESPVLADSNIAPRKVETSPVYNAPPSAATGFSVIQKKRLDESTNQEFKIGLAESALGNSQRLTTGEASQGNASTGGSELSYKAYLYEEGAEGSGATRDEANVIWSFEKVSSADGFPPELVIKGKVEVPSRKLMLDLTITRNVDNALPASHIIEIYIETPPDFSGGSIENIARFVMKASEQARGEGLVAVPAKIDKNYFLLALNNLEQAVATNMRLLTESSWIDIPMGYATKQRALITIEKGAIGDALFREAIAAWAEAAATAQTQQ
jgi:hypothetical protein